VPPPKTFDKNYFIRFLGSGVSMMSIEKMVSVRYIGRFLSTFLPEMAPQPPSSKLERIRDQGVT
jgi:hypothetical protein